MEKRGLCSACVYDKECVFPRRYPIWECEEFSIFLPSGNSCAAKKKTKHLVKVKA